VLGEASVEVGPKARWEKLPFQLFCQSTSPASSFVTLLATIPEVGLEIVFVLDDLPGSESNCVADKPSHNWFVSGHGFSRAAHRQ
jgi:hypothetical protein